MDTLTAQERRYDWQVTNGRFDAGVQLFEVGYWLGILGDYLDGAFVDDVRFHAERRVWYFGPTFDEAIDVGSDNRAEHTAEDLYVWAHDWMSGRTWPGGPAY